MGFFGTAPTPRFEPRELITFFLSSSPRPQDEGDEGALMLHQAVLSARRTLALRDAPTVLVFDGRHPDLSDGAWRAYQRKIALARGDPLLRDCAVVEHAVWLHQAHGLRVAMAEHAGARPVVFSMQDDCVCFGEVDTRAVVRALLRDPLVEYVKLCWRADLRSDAYEMQPFAPHPTEPLLRSTHFWSDRPHFALRSHYERRVWPRIPAEARVTMEQAVEALSAAERDWNLWMYGRPGDMRREAHSKYATASSYFVRDNAPCDHHDVHDSA